ncbi:hypothetical protein [Pelodictyon luteolum]|nr:hypothetical protein [Pelodictyon luteolum]
MAPYTTWFLRIGIVLLIASVLSPDIVGASQQAVVQTKISINVSESFVQYLQQRRNASSERPLNPSLSPSAPDSSAVVPERS